MREAEEGLYAELATTGSSAWARLHADVTSQLTAPSRRSPTAAPSACRCRPCAASPPHADPAVRRAAYDAEVDGVADGRRRRARRR